MCMVQDDLSREQRKVQEELMCDLPNWKQRIAGKSIPMEKFAILKARRFLDQKNKLVLPVLELIYLWNGFKLIGNSYKSVEPFYNMVEMAFVEHNKGKCYAIHSYSAKNNHDSQLSQKYRSTTVFLR